MAWDTALEELMVDTVTIAPFSSMNDAGGYTYGTGVSYVARVVRKNTRVLDFSGRETVSATTVYVAPKAGALPLLDPRAKITLPDGTTPNIMSVAIYPDEDGPHHAVVYCGR